MANLSNKSGKLEIAKVNMSTCKEGGNLIVFLKYMFYFFNFVMQSNWQLSTRRFSQIWL
jgi:hypothetical protein